MSMHQSSNGQVIELFDQFVAASNLKSVLTSFRRICHLLGKNLA